MTIAPRKETTSYVPPTGTWNILRVTFIVASKVSARSETPPAIIRTLRISSEIRSSPIAGSAYRCFCSCVFLSAWTSATIFAPSKPTAPVRFTYSSVIGLRREETVSWSAAESSMSWWL